MKPFNENIKELELIVPLFAGLHLNRQLTSNFSVKEYYEATKLTEQEREDYTKLPYHKDLPTAVQMIRDAYGKPLYLGSVYRSLAWELEKGRSGDSQHTHAHAFDINGGDTLEKQIEFQLWFEQQYNDKTPLYHKLKNLGVNAFGVYDWGWHLDFRPSKENGDDFFWDSRKKKDDMTLLCVVITALALFVGYKWIK